MTKTKANLDARDNVAKNLNNVDDLYDKLSSCTESSDDEELYKQVHVNLDVPDNKSSSIVPATMLMYLQAYLVLMVMLGKSCHDMMVEVVKSSKSSPPIVPSPITWYSSTSAVHSNCSPTKSTTSSSIARCSYAEHAPPCRGSQGSSLFKRFVGKLRDGKSREHGKLD